MDEKLVIQIDLDESNIGKSLKNIEGKAKKSGSTIGKNISSGIGTALKVGAIGFTAVLAGTAALTLASRRFIDAAKVQEDAVNSLNIALASSGQLSEQTSQDFQDFASSLQQTTRFGDEVILQNAALIQSLGKLDQEGLKQATIAATDLSAALGIDLRSAATLVGKAAAGEVSSFSRYGVSIKKAGTNAETFKRTIDALNKSFGGAAAGQIINYAGASEQLGNTIGDVAEELGFAFTKSAEFIAITKVFNQVFQNLGEVIKRNRDVLQEYVATGVELLRRSIVFSVNAFNLAVAAVKEFGSAILPTAETTRFFSGEIEGLGNTANIALGGLVNIGKIVSNSLLTAFESIKSGLFVLIGGVNEALKIVGVDLGISDVIDNELVKTSESINNRISEIGDVGSRLFSTEKLAEDGALFTEQVGALFENIKTAGTGDDGKSFLAEIFEPFSADNFNKIVSNVKALSGGVLKNTKDLGGGITKFSKQASFDLKNRLGGGIAAGVQNLTNSLISGGDVFGNFAKFVLGTIGDLATQLGTFFIIQGIALEALKGLSGAQAIVAGAGLVALGSILKNLGAGGGSALSGSSDSGGIVSSSGNTFTPTDTATGAEEGEEEAERQDPDTNINVVVNGNILDRQETGLALAEIIRDTIDDQGVVINGESFA